MFFQSQDLWWKGRVLFSSKDDGQIKITSCCWSNKNNFLLLCRMQKLVHGWGKMCLVCLLLSFNTASFFMNLLFYHLISEKINCKSVCRNSLIYTTPSRRLGTTRICHAYKRNTDFTHKQWSIRHHTKSDE